jgi:hypothetical protein
MAIRPIPDQTVWRPAPVLALIVAVFGVLVLYRDTAASIVHVWGSIAITPRSCSVLGRRIAPRPASRASQRMKPVNPIAA